MEERVITEEYWVLEFTDGKYKGQFLHVTPVHENIVGVEKPSRAASYSSEERAVKAVGYHTLHKLITRHVTVSYTIS